MSLWRLEWIRLTRTRRWIALLGVYLFFGLLGPLTARYVEAIVKNFGGGIQITVPPPVPADGMTNYISNAIQIGLLVSLGLAAGALAFDARPQMGVFLRTRVDSIRGILTPRYAVWAGATVVAFLAGSAIALYETTVLIGAPPIGGWVLGTLLGCLYLLFAVAVVAAVAGKAPSVLMTVVISIVALLLLPVIGIVPDVGRWLPSHLVGGIDALVRNGSFGDYVGSTLVTVAATAGALWLAVHWARQREL
jgi:ABC-2 type transport system permease protein